MIVEAIRWTELRGPLQIGQVRKSRRDTLTFMGARPCEVAL